MRESFVARSDAVDVKITVAGSSPHVEGVSDQLKHDLECWEFQIEDSENDTTGERHD